MRLILEFIEKEPKAALLIAGVALFILGAYIF